MAVKQTCSMLDGRTRVAGMLLCKECMSHLSKAAQTIAVNAVPLHGLALREWKTPSHGHSPRSPFAPAAVNVAAWDVLNECAQTVRLAARACGCSELNGIGVADPFFGGRTTAKVMSVGESLQFQASWIAGSPEGLARRQDVMMWLRKLEALAAKVDSIVNHKERDSSLIGSCSVCGGPWAEHSAPVGECKECGRMQLRCEVGDRLIDLLASSEVTGTASELSRECAKAGIKVPTATIRSWAKRGALHKDAEGKFSMSDLAPLLKRRAEAGERWSSRSQDI